MTRSQFVQLVMVMASVAACSDSPAPTPDPTFDGTLEAVSVIDQVGPVGASVSVSPAVRLRRRTGQPASGILVTFQATNGSIVVPAAATTGADGIARVTSWSHIAGSAELRAAVPGVAPVVFRAEGKPRTFDLVIRWLETPSAEARTAVEAAEAIIEKIIWEDVPDERVDATPACNLPGVGPAATIDETVDDVLILARVGPIDGLGGAGAQGFPCLIRDPGTQTVVGFVRFDEAEFGAIDQNLRREFALHEMVHALGLVPGLLNITTPSGFRRNCLQLASTGAPNTLVQDSHFSCENARAAFDRIGGATYAGAKVPLENGATRPLGPNTLNHHWRKASFGSELMTGWFDANVRAPLSQVTVGALADLGYTVSYSAADAFTFQAAAGAAPATRLASPGFQLEEPARMPPAVTIPAKPR